MLQVYEITRNPGIHDQFKYSCYADQVIDSHYSAGLNVSLTWPYSQLSNSILGLLKFSRSLIVYAFPCISAPSTPTSIKAEVSK